MSQISCLRAGLNDEGYSHILSFLRKVYINSDDLQKLPEKIQLNYDNTNYWIYFDWDTFKCYVCNKEGHIGRNCPENVNTSDLVQSQLDNNETTNNLEDTVLRQTSSLTIPEAKNEPTFADSFIPNLPTKRAYPESTTGSMITEKSSVESKIGHQII